jgi:hypothetical protein
MGMIATFLALLSAPVLANPDVLVAPRRPGQSNVRWYDFEWQSVDILEEQGGGVRLYFYERERGVAERATGIVEEVWHELGDDFGAYPERRFPFVLYSSYQEFLRTNLFPLGEGVLGVTSPRNLTLTLPWFGDDRLFRDVAKHELAHQFTIQEVQSASRDLDLYADPLNAMPLWFIEGLAEYYAQGGLDPEAEMVAVDLATNPDPIRGSALGGFWEDRPWDVSWTYKMGQVRCAFLEETYGEGTIQEILDAAPRLVSAPRKNGGFDALVADLVERSPERIDADFDTWVKRRAFQQWLDVEQHEVIPVEEIDRAEAIDASPDGRVLVIRSMDFERGVSRLQLVDPKDPRQRKTLAADNRPGTESLHPVSDRTFDVSNDTVVWIAESRGHDVLYVQEFEHGGKKEKIEPVPPIGTLRDDPLAEPMEPLQEAEEVWKVDWNLGAKRRYRLDEHGLVAAFSPAIGPDGRIAFVGLTLEGYRDIYVLDIGSDALVQVTDDEHSERQVVWGPAGIVYTSDATATGHYNLFRANPEGGGAPEQLTFEARDESSPTYAGERLLFTAWEDGRSNLYELRDGEIRRRTDVSTGLFEPAPGRDGKVWALSYQGGRKRPAEVRLRDDVVVSYVRPDEADAPEPLPVFSLAESTPYKGLNPENWRMDGVFGYAGGGSGGVYGQLLAISSDVLRTRTLTLDFAMYGRPEYSDGYLLLSDQSRRATWGVGPFQFLRYRIAEEEGVEFLSVERFFGGLGSLRLPLNRFLYVQGDVGVGGATGFVFPDTRAYLEDPDINGIGDLYDPWAKDNVGVQGQGEATLRFGADTVGFHVRTGPLTGNALLVETTLGGRPADTSWYGSTRLDAQKYVPILGAMNLGFSVSGGVAYGERLQNWWLSSLHTLRGIPLGSSLLVGEQYAVGTAELQVPLDAIIRLAFVSNLEAVAAIDAGGIGDSPEDIWDRRVLDGVIGGNVIFGPLVLRLHFARPFDVGAPLPTGAEPRWVPNVSLDWLYR